MSHLYKLFKSVFVLILNNRTNAVGEDCIQFCTKVQDHINSLGEKRGKSGISDNLRTSLTHLSTAVVSLRTCFKNLADGSQPEKNSTSKKELPEAKSTIKETSEDDTTELPTSETEHLVHENTKKFENEILKVKASGKDFEDAMNFFAESKNLSTEVFKTADESERETKVIATKVRVICEILENLTNLTGAAEQCVKYISELQNIFSLKRSPSTLRRKIDKEMDHLDDVIYINTVVFRFIKEFIRKPVPMLDWPMIDVANEESYKKRYHPLLGKKSESNTVQLFTDVNGEEITINLGLSVVKCDGEVLAPGIPKAKDRRSSSTGITIIFILLLGWMRLKLSSRSG